MTSARPDRHAADASSADLFDESVISAYLDVNPGVERPWLADLVDAHIADPQCRFVLVTGSTGSGKSAFMAATARRHDQSLRYFLRRDSIVPHRHGDAHALLESLGHQLATRHPRTFSPQRLSIEVEQHIGELRTDAKATAIRVEELYGSPFYATAVRVDQSVAIASGDVAAVEVGRIVTDPRSHGWEALERMALTGPAQIVSDDQPQARIVVLIDALDEADTAGGFSILDWLGAVRPLPAALRIVVTSRPGPFLSRFRDRQARWLREIRLDDHPDQTRADVRRYMVRASGSAAVIRAAAAAAMTPESYAQRIAEQAEGNFQFAVACVRTAAVWQDLDEAPQLNAAGAGLPRPAALTQLYRALLTALWNRTRRRPVRLQGTQNWGDLWGDVIRPILGVLSVARSPLTRGQIAAFAQLPVGDPELGDALDELSPLLEVRDGTHRLFHASFAETLLGEASDDSAAPLAGAARTWHLRMAGQEDDDATALPDSTYRWWHTIAHLAAAHELSSADAQSAIAQRIRDLVGSFEYLCGKAASAGIDALLGDVRLALRVGGSDTGELMALARILDQEAHELRGWDAGADPAAFAQHLQHRATARGMTELAQAARGWLDRTGHAYLRTDWVHSRTSPALVRTLIGHEGAVTRIISLPGGRAVSGGADGRVVLWDIAGGRSLWSLLAHSGAVRGLDAVGSVLVTSSPGDTPRLWDLATGTSCGQLDMTEPPSVVVSAGDGLLAAAGHGLITVWNVAENTVVRRLRAPDGAVPQALTAADGTLFAAFGDRIHSWHLRGQPADPAVEEPGTVFTVARATAHGAHQGDTGSVEVVDLVVVGGRRVLAMASRARTRLDATAEHPLSVIGVDSSITCAAVSGRHLITGSSTYILVERLLTDDPSDSDEIRVTRFGHNSNKGLAGHNAAVTTVSVSDGAEILSGDRDGTVRVWDLRTAVNQPDQPFRIPDLEPEQRYVMAASSTLMVLPGRRLTVCPTSDDRIPDRLKHEYLDRLRAPEVATVTDDGWVAAFSVGPRGFYHKYGTLYSSVPHTIQIWHCPSRVLHHAISCRRIGSALLLTPAGRLVIGCSDGTVTVHKGRRVRGIATNRPSGTGFSATPEAFEVPGHDARITHLALFNDNRMLSGAQDGSLCLWQSDQWHPTRVADSPHRAAITSGALLASGRIITTDAAGVAALWDPAMTEATIIRTIPGAHLRVLSGRLLAAHGTSIDIYPEPDDTTTLDRVAGLRLPANAEAVTATADTVLIDDAAGGRHRLILIDPTLPPKPQPPPRPRRAPKDSLYGWPSLTRRLTAPLICLTAMSMIGLLSHSLADRISVGLWAGTAGVALVVMAIRDRG